MSNIKNEEHQEYDKEYWAQVGNLASTTLTYKSIAYRCYYINFDNARARYKYPSTCDTVILLDIDTREMYDAQFQPIIPSHLSDKIYFEISDWMNINETQIGKRMCFIALAFPNNTQFVDVFALIRNFITNEFPNHFVQTNDDQPLTNNATNHKRLMVMNLSTSMIYNVGVNTI